MDELIKEAALRFHEYPNPGKIQVAPTKVKDTASPRWYAPTMVTLMVFRDNVLVYREAGALPAPALDSLITQVRELDMDELKAKIAEEEAASGAQA